MNILTNSINKEEISIYNKELEHKINNGAVAIVRLYQDVDHYCLLTKIDDDYKIVK